MGYNSGIESIGVGGSLCIQALWGPVRRYVILLEVRQFAILMRTQENLAAGTGGGYGIPQAIMAWTNEACEFEFVICSMNNHVT